MIPEELVAKYNEDGAILLPGVFSPPWVEKVRAGIARNLESPSQYGEMLRPVANKGAYFNDYCNWTHIGEFRDYVYTSPAAAVAGQLMRSSKSVFYHEHVLVKEPRTPVPTPWHYDQAYYPIDGHDICSIWMPVDHVSLDVTIRFVKGSHLWPDKYFPRKFRTSKNYAIATDNTEAAATYKDIPVTDIDAGRYELLAWQCQPGDCVVFHGKTIHGAQGNDLNSSRRVLSTRWLGDDAKIATRPWAISPPTTGGLAPGQQPCMSPDFPTVWNRQST